jgi:hypothetical protein
MSILMKTQLGIVILALAAWLDLASYTTNAACTYSLSPASRTHGPGAVASTVGLTTATGCPWTVVNTSAWITITSPLSGTGSATVSYTVSDNPSHLARTNVVLIGGQTFTLGQLGADCTYHISPTNRPHGYGAASGTISVTAPLDCPWTVVNTNGWITITSSLNGSGSGSVSYSVDANPSSIPRSGVVTVDGGTFTINQAGVPCTYSLSPDSRPHGNGATVGTVNVSTISDCAWTVSNNCDWMTITSSTNGLGNGTVSYSVEANLNHPTRTNVVIIGDQPFTVTQSGVDCTYKLSPTNRPHGYGATTGMVSMTTAGGCPWTVVNTNDWITITSDTSCMGSGTISYTVDANPSSLPRTGFVTADGGFFTINQAGMPCTVSISPTNRPHGYGATTGLVSVATAIACPWTVVNTNDWITITSSLNGAGSGSVSYTVTANPSSLPRTGFVTVNEGCFTINQAGMPCTVSISPTNRPHGYGATTGMVSVATGGGCPWAVVNNNDWITITSDLNGTGSGSVSYTVAANLSSTPRCGVIGVDGGFFTVTQAGLPCMCKLSPTNRVHGFGMTTNTVALTVGSDCPWNIINTNDWIIITSGTNGLGNATISYLVAANLTPDARSGVITIGDQVLTLQQWGATAGFVFEEISLPALGQVQLRLSGAPAGVWSLQRSFDMLQWDTIASLTNATGVVEYIDTVPADSNRRFYRAVQP